MSTFIVALLYFICFIATLQMSVDDTLISVDPVITQLDLTNWSQLNSVRYITTFLAWIGYSILFSCVKRCVISGLFA